MTTDTASDTKIQILLNSSSICSNEKNLKRDLEEAKNLILNDNVVAMPTETVYGLAANALSREAVAKIFTAKNRPQDNPLIVHVSTRQMLYDLLQPDLLPAIYEKLLDAFWPGPLTILVKKPACIPDCVSAGQDTIAVRMPAHPIARALIEVARVPLAAPSANTSGRPSPTLAIHVFNDLKGRIPLILDGGPCESGVESTVIDGLRCPPAILRPGGVTVEQLEAVLGEKVLVYKRDFEDKQMELAPTTPGMKYRHYSPNCSVILVEAHKDSSHDTQSSQMTRLQSQYNALCETLGNVGVLLVNPESPDLFPIQSSLGSDSKQVAQSLFSKLREMEALGVSAILVQGILEDNEGLAVMNRLRKCSSQIV